MTNDPKHRADDEHINVEQPQELAYWAEKFGVTHDEIRAAVRVAGPVVADVRRRLAQNRSY